LLKRNDGPYKATAAPGVMLALTRNETGVMLALTRNERGAARIVAAPFPPRFLESDNKANLRSLVFGGQKFVSTGHRRAQQALTDDAR